MEICLHAFIGKIATNERFIIDWVLSPENECGDDRILGGPMGKSTDENLRFLRSNRTTLKYALRVNVTHRLKPTTMQPLARNVGAVHRAVHER